MIPHTTHEAIARTYETQIIDTHFLTQRLLGHERPDALLALCRHVDLFHLELALVDTSGTIADTNKLYGQQLRSYFLPGLDRCLKWLFDERVGRAVCAPPEGVGGDSMTFLDLAMRYCRIEDAFVKLSRRRAHVIADAVERRLVFSWIYEPDSFPEWFSFTEVTPLFPPSDAPFDVDRLFFDVQRTTWTDRLGCCLLDRAPDLIAVLRRYWGPSHAFSELGDLRSVLGVSGDTVRKFLSALQEWSHAVQLRMLLFHRGRQQLPSPGRDYRFSSTQVVTRPSFIHDICSVSDLTADVVEHLLSEFTFSHPHHEIWTRPLLQERGMVLWSPKTMTEVATDDLLKRFSSDPRSTKETQAYLNGREHLAIDRLCSKLQERGFSHRSRRRYSVGTLAGDVDVCAVHPSKPDSALICELKSPLTTRTTQDGESLSEKILHGQRQIQRAVSAVSGARAEDLSRWFPGIHAERVQDWDGAVVVEGGFPRGSVSHKPVPVVTLPTLLNRVPDAAWANSHTLWQYLVERGMTEYLKPHRGAFVRIPIGSITCDIPAVQFVTDSPYNDRLVYEWAQMNPWYDDTI